MDLYVCGDPVRSSRYTRVLHAEIGAPHKQWQVYINKHHTDYVPLTHDEGERAARVMELGKRFGLKPTRRTKPDARHSDGTYTLLQVRVPKTDLAGAPAWDGTFIEEGTEYR